jgi:hypothetical protein
MKRMLSMSVVMGAALFIVVPALGDVFVFTPSQSDLGDLDHNYSFVWGLKWQLAPGQIIESATLTYKNIYNWNSGTNVLYTHLLDTVVDPNGGQSPNWAQKAGYQTITIKRYDDESMNDAFLNQGVKLGEWSDPDGPLTKTNLSYSISAANLSWLEDGNFGFGVDPDCHYYNDKVSLTIVTRPELSPPVPAPGAAVLGLLGLVVTGWVKRRLA